MTKQATHFFCYVGYGTKAKNNLQKEFQKFLEETGGTLVESCDLPKLKKTIIEKVTELNKKHSRCQPLTVSFWETHKNNWAISGFYCQIFHIMPAILTK